MLSIGQSMRAEKKDMKDEIETKKTEKITKKER
jgi:hypothetical protein